MLTSISIFLLFYGLFSVVPLLTLEEKKDGDTSSNNDILNQHCYSSEDCPSGTECVAASATDAIQTCVKSPSCGGPTAGNCPVFEHIGQLLCVWVHSEDLCRDEAVKCKDYNGKQGIYKCASNERCNELFKGNETCSDQCNANDKPCNGRGSCQSTGDSSFACLCDSGWSGQRCDEVSSGACMDGSGECGDHGECKDGRCVCVEGWSGIQCEIGPEEEETKEEAKGKSKSTAKPEGISAKSKVKKGKGGVWIYIVVALVAILLIGALVGVYVQKQNRKRRMAEEQQVAMNDIITSRMEDELVTATTAAHTPRDHIVKL